MSPFKNSILGHTLFRLKSTDGQRGKDTGRDHAVGYRWAINMV